MQEASPQIPKGHKHTFRKCPVFRPIQTFQVNPVERRKLFTSQNQNSQISYSPIHNSTSGVLYYPPIPILPVYSEGKLAFDYVRGHH